MTILCRIKKLLNIKSPSPYEYCKLNLNAANKKRCLKCKHFKQAQFQANLMIEKMVEYFVKLNENTRKLKNTLNEVVTTIEGGNENNEKDTDIV